MDANLGTSDKKRKTTETATPKIVNLTPKRTSERNRGGLSTVQMDSAKNNLTISWSGLTLAGKQSDDVDIETEGTHSCGATAEMSDFKIVKGAFDSDDCHAEMDVLQKAIAAGYTLNDIVAIEIEKQPCPRCAVVLNKLHLNTLVKYKKVGQKDYPTWRYPNLGGGHNWAVTMGVSGYAARDDQQNTLLNYFRSHKWWG